MLLPAGVMGEMVMLYNKWDAFYEFCGGEENAPAGFGDCRGQNLGKSHVLGMVSEQQPAAQNREKAPFRVKRV
eukprot:SAG22_NODE_1258_length_4983_cov_2.401925_8_plen_73_part_00